MAPEQSKCSIVKLFSRKLLQDEIYLLLETEQPKNPIVLPNRSRSGWAFSYSKCNVWIMLGIP